MSKQCYIQTLFDLTTAVTVSSGRFDMTEANEAAIHLESTGTVTGAFTIYERVKDEIEVKPHTEMEVKGKSRPIEVFEVIGLKTMGE